MKYLLIFECNILVDSGEISQQPFESNILVSSSEIFYSPLESNILVDFGEIFYLHFEFLHKLKDYFIQGGRNNNPNHRQSKTYLIVKNNLTL